MGMMIADKLDSGDSGKMIINQLVGMATESIVLSDLDKNTAYDFLNGQTPAEVAQQLKTQKKPLVELIKQFDAASPQMSDGEQANYRQRTMIYGEIAAMKRVVEQHPPTEAAK